MPKEVLLKCADKLITEGKIREPFATFTPQERFINDLYGKTIPIWVFSKFYPGDIKSYAKEVNKMADEFMIDKLEKHKIETTDNSVLFLEIAYGDFDEDDIIRLEDKYGRV